MSDQVGNYVNVNPLQLGNYVSADTRGANVVAGGVTARSRRYSFPGRDHRTHVRFTATE